MLKIYNSSFFDRIKFCLVFSRKTTVVFHRGLIPTPFFGLLATAAAIIYLTDWVLDDFHRRTRLNGKAISHRRCRSPIVLKIAVRADADLRRNDAVSVAIRLVEKRSPTVHFSMQLLMANTLFLGN